MRPGPSHLAGVDDIRPHTPSRRNLGTSRLRHLPPVRAPTMTAPLLPVAPHWLGNPRRWTLAIPRVQLNPLDIAEDSYFRHVGHRPSRSFIRRPDSRPYPWRDGKIGFGGPWYLFLDALPPLVTDQWLVISACTSVNIITDSLDD